MTRPRTVMSCNECRTKNRDFWALIYLWASASEILGKGIWINLLKKDGSLSGNEIPAYSISFYLLSLPRTRIRPGASLAGS